MTADDLQRYASLCRWIGLAVTFVGIVITFGSHAIADRLIAVQRVEKSAAQERAKVSQAELDLTKQKTADLEFRLAPRRLSEAQREQFTSYLAKIPKGAVSVAHSGLSVETVNFSEDIRSLLESAGFQISSYENPLGYIIKAPSPWFIAIIMGPGDAPPYAVKIQEAFKAIGVDAIGTDGSKIASPGEVKVYIGAK